MSYVVLGAVAAPRVHGDRVVAALIAFFLAVGVGAHAFDELHDRPLRTGLSSPTLAVIGGAALLGAVGIGVAGIVTVSITLAPLVLFGAAICLSYNLELLGGRFHSDAWFALAWGAFPAVTGYWVNALRVSVPGLLVAAACVGFSVLQRRLSTASRLLRRRTASVTGEQRLTDGTSIRLSRSVLLSPLDGALRAMSIAITLLAAGLLAMRLA
ncbi:MAG TPA: hypothetical protein VIM18_04525 [Solirubrobacteraceae bacterium]